jgi:hypothetical protein
MKRETTEQRTNRIKIRNATLTLDFLNGVERDELADKYCMSYRGVCAVIRSFHGPHPWALAYYVEKVGKYLVDSENGIEVKAVLLAYLEKEVKF